MSLFHFLITSLQTGESAPYRIASVSHRSHRPARGHRLPLPPHPSAPRQQQMEAQIESMAKEAAMAMNSLFVELESSDFGFKHFSVAIFDVMVDNNPSTLLLSIFDNELMSIFLK